MESKRAGLLFALAVAVLGLIGALWLYDNREAVAAWAMAQVGGQVPAEYSAEASKPVSLDEFVRAVQTAMQSADLDQIRKVYHYAGLPPEAVEARLAEEVNGARNMVYGEATYITAAEAERRKADLARSNIALNLKIEQNLPYEGYIFLPYQPQPGQLPLVPDHPYRRARYLPVGKTPQGEWRIASPKFLVAASIDEVELRMAQKGSNAMERWFNELPQLPPVTQSRLDSFKQKLTHAFNEGSREDRLALFGLEEMPSGVRSQFIEEFVNRPAGVELMQVGFKQESFRLYDQYNMRVAGVLYFAVSHPPYGHQTLESYGVGINEHGQFQFPRMVQDPLSRSAPQ
ncbi:MAG: hypothetical protein AAGK14_01510 [Verrucomicrobiota bacterium]